MMSDDEIRAALCEHCQGGDIAMAGQHVRYGIEWACGAAPLIAELDRLRAIADTAAAFVEASEGQWYDRVDETYAALVQAVKGGGDEKVP